MTMTLPTPNPKPNERHICQACAKQWEARKPRPAGVWCWHKATVAIPVADGWRYQDGIGQKALEEMREDGLV